MLIGYLGATLPPALVRDQRLLDLGACSSLYGNSIHMYHDVYSKTGLHMGHRRLYDTPALKWANTVFVSRC